MYARYVQTRPFGFKNSKISQEFNVKIKCIGIETYMKICLNPLITECLEMQLESIS